MPKALPYYPMYVNDFDEDPDVLDMNLAEVGLYILCLNESWKRGSIPMELEKLAVRLRRPLTDVHDAWPAVSSCWTPVAEGSSRLVNPRQELERDKAETISGVRSYAAKLSHQKKSAFADASAGADAGTNATYESVSKSSSKILSKKEDELSPQVKWSIFQTRIKKAGVKFNFRYSEKKQAQEWLAGCEETFDDILAALQVFAEDEYWTGQGHPWNAWPKQFDQFLETARAAAQDDGQGDDEGVEDDSQPEATADATQRAVVPKRDFLAEWNLAVPEAFTERKLERYHATALLEIDEEFIAKFEEICEVARKVRRARPDSTWLTFYHLLATKEGEVRPNWTRVLTTNRWMAGPTSPESGQTDDEVAYQRWAKGGVKTENVGQRLAFARRYAAEMMASED